MTTTTTRTGICPVCHGPFNLEDGGVIETHYLGTSERSAELCHGSQRLPIPARPGAMDRMLKLEYDHINRLGLPVSVTCDQLFPNINVEFREEIKRDQRTNQLVTTRTHFDEAVTATNDLMTLSLEDVQNLDDQQLTALVKTAQLLAHAHLQFKLFQALIENTL